MPAGDIGVGGREIGYLFGQYKQLRNEFTGVLTGKGLNWGGSLIRPEATGYGAVYFAAGDARDPRRDASRARPASSPARGNVAQYTVEKLLELGGKAVTLSDSNGYIYDEDGIDREKLAFVMDLKNVRRGRIKEYADKFKGAVYTPIDAKPTTTRCGTSRPTAPSRARRRTRSTRKDAANLLKNGVLRASPRAPTCRPTPDGVDVVPRRQDPLRPRQGGQRRRRGHLRPRDVAEQHAPRAGRAKRSTSACTTS